MELKGASRSNNKAIHRYDVHQASRSTFIEETAERPLDELINAFIDGELYIMSLRQLVDRISVGMTEVYAH